jgi:hypothetical protein
MAFDKKGPHAGKFSVKCKPVDALSVREICVKDKH